MLQAGGVRVRPSFLDSVNQPVNADAVIENARAAADHQAPITRRLPRKAGSRAKVAERDSILSGKLPIELPDSRRNWAMAALFWRTGAANS